MSALTPAAPDNSGTPVAPTAELTSLAKLMDTALSSICDFAYVFDLDGRFIYVNKALLDLWGKSLAEAVGKNFFDLEYPPDLAAKLQRQIQQVIDTREGLTDETPYQNAQGVGGYYEYIFKPVFGTDGNVEVVAGSTRDITSRKRADDALRESDRQLQEVFNSAPAFMAVLRGPNFVFEQANRAYLNLVGGRADIIGKPLLEALPEVADQPFPDILNKVMDTGQAYHGSDVRLMLKQREDGPLEEVWVDFVYQPLRDPEGNVTGVLAHGVNLTERKRAEKDLRESEMRFSGLVRATSDALYRLSPDWSQMLQVQGQDFVKDVSEPITTWQQTYIPPDELPHVMEAVREAIRTKSTFEMEHRIIRRNGETGWTFSRAVPLLDDDGEIVEWFGAATDVTEQKLASFELMAMRDRAVEANRVKSAFLANISHELRTPLNAIIGYAEMVTEELEDANQEALANDVKSIVVSGRHLLTLINDILDLSKIEAGKMDIRIEEVSVETLIHDVAETMRPLAFTNNNELHIVCRPECGLLRTDSLKLRQILLNLVSNALKFTENGTVNLDVEREISSGREWIIFKVSDTGIGMSPEHVKLLFRDFTQLDPSSTRKYGGTGLGLAISQRFSHMIGGDISVRSEVGKGSVFTVRLPSRLEEAPSA